MQSSLVETLIGAVVLAVAGVFFFFAYHMVDAGGTNGLHVTARFDRIDGISVGSDVRMSGIKIGTVSDLTLDEKNYLAKAVLSISKDIPLPDDSSVKITNEGLLGGAYLSIEPGGSETNLADGGELQNTQGSVDLVGLLGRAVFGAGGDTGNKKPAPGPTPETAPAPTEQPQAQPPQQ